MKILKSILNYIPLATFIIFVVTDGIFSLTSALIFVISTIGLLINWKRKKQRWRIEKIQVYGEDSIIIIAWKKVRSTLVRPGRQPWPIDVYYLSRLPCTRKYVDRWDETNNE